jgi:hypothetical protein
MRGELCLLARGQCDFNDAIVVGQPRACFFRVTTARLRDKFCETKPLTAPFFV